MFAASAIGRLNHRRGRQCCLFQKAIGSNPPLPCSASSGSRPPSDRGPLSPTKRIMSWMELDLVLTGCCVRPLSGKWINISRERPAGKENGERGLWMLRRWRRGVWVQIERRGFPASLRRNPKQLIGTFVCSSHPLTRWERDLSMSHADFPERGNYRLAFTGTDCLFMAHFWLNIWLFLKPWYNKTQNQRTGMMTKSVRRCSIEGANMLDACWLYSFNSWSISYIYTHRCISIN